MTRDEVIAFLRQNASKDQWASTEVKLSEGAPHVFGWLTGEKLHCYSRLTEEKLHFFYEDVLPTLSSAGWYLFRYEDERLCFVDNTGRVKAIHIEDAFPNNETSVYRHGDKVKVKGNPGKTFAFGCYRPNDPERCVVFSSTAVFECDVDRLSEPDEVFVRRQMLEALSGKDKVSAEEVVDTLISMTMDMLKPKN